MPLDFEAAKMLLSYNAPILDDHQIGLADTYSLF
jgi:hypothetical protein